MEINILDIERIELYLENIVKILNDNLNDTVKVYNHREYEYWVGVTRQDPPFRDAEWEEISLNIEDPGTPMINLTFTANNCEYIDIELPLSNLAYFRENLDFEIAKIDKRKEAAAEERKAKLLQNEVIDKQNRRNLYEKLKAEFELQEPPC